MRVHVIEADQAEVWVKAVMKRDNLGKAIAALAAQLNEPVWFHDYKDPMVGAPLIFLECSDTFLEQVRKLPDFKKTYDAQSKPYPRPTFFTERSEKLQVYYTGKANAVNYYSLHFTRIKKLPQRGDGLADVFNFQRLMKHAVSSSHKVFDYLEQNNLLLQVCEIHHKPNENRMILLCPDTLIEELKKLDCIEGARLLTEREIKALPPKNNRPQKPPAP